MRILVTVDPPGPFAPGDTVAGRVDVAEGGGARSLTVRLAFVERSEDYTHVARTAGEVRLAEGDLADGFSAPFSIALPADAPPGFACEQGSLRWVLRAWADRFGPDAAEEVSVGVQPPAANP